METTVVLYLFQYCVSSGTIGFKLLSVKLLQLNCYKASGGNEKLPYCRIPMVRIVWEFR